MANNDLYLHSKSTFGRKYCISKLLRVLSLYVDFWSKTPFKHVRKKINFSETLPSIVLQFFKQQAALCFLKNISRLLYFSKRLKELEELLCQEIQKS